MEVSGSDNTRPADRIRILIAEDHQTVREGIKLLVNTQSDMQIVGEADDGDRAIELTSNLEPDVVVMDISMPGSNGLKATQVLRSRHPSLRILTLTRHSDDGYLRQLIAAGSNGYVLKQSAPTELLTAIRVVARGDSFVDPALTAKVMGGFAGRTAAVHEGGHGELSAREEEVIRLLALGYSNKEIAARLDLSVKTIESHRANAMRKLGISSRIDIVQYAITQGWMSDK